MLDRVTLTGADDSVLPARLVSLWQEFPFVEFGILWSDKHTGSPRFPSGDWLAMLAKLAVGSKLPLSLHLCGRAVRGLLVGEEARLPGPSIFQRIQLNFHGEDSKIEPVAFGKSLQSLGKRQIIFQFDGVSGQNYFDRMFEETELGLDCVALYDLSGGAGEVPAEWPKPEYLTTDCDFAYHGYAGGLGPENVVSELKRIRVATAPAPGMHEARFWIDMETRILSDGDQRFDLNKCRRVLELCRPLIGVRS
jgi:hypothetical protein